MFARKHVSVIPVSIVPWIQLSQKKESIAGRSMAVRAAPRNAIRVRLIKKPSGERRSAGLNVLLLLCPSFRILAFRFAPPKS